MTNTNEAFCRRLFGAVLGPMDMWSIYAPASAPTDSCRRSSHRSTAVPGLSTT